MENLNPNRARAERLRQQVERACREIAGNAGLALSQATATYSQTNVRVSVEFADIGKDGIVENAEAEYFRQRATLHGLQASDLGRTFRDGQGKVFKIVGLRPRARKNPIVFQDETGRRFVASGWWVSRMLLTDPGDKPEFPTYRDAQGNEHAEF